MAGFRQGGLSLKKRDNGSASDINFVSFYVDSFDRLYSVDTFGTSALVSNQWSAGCIDEDIPELIKTTDSITVPELRVAIFSTPNFRGPLFRKTIAQATFSIPRDGFSKYVVVDYDSGTPYFRIETDFHNINNSNVVHLYTVWNTSGPIHSILFDNKGEGLANKIDTSITRTTPYRRSIEGGLMISVDGSRYIHISDSHVYAGTTEVQIASFNSSLDRVTEVYHTAGSWVFAETMTGYQVDNLHYDNGTNLAVAGNNKYVCRWVYRTIGDDKEVFLRIGTAEYNNSTDAQAEQEPFSPSIVKEHGMLVGRIVIQKGSSTATYQSIFDLFSSSSSGGVSNHNDLSYIQGGDAINSEYYHLDYERASYISAVSADVQTQINDLKMLTSGTGITQVYADAHYLKLDGSNGPITSNLSILGTLSASSVSATNLTATNIQGTSISVGNVSNTEFQRLDGVSANIQPQFTTLSATKADKSVIISGTNGISGGGDLTQDRTLSLSTTGTAGTYTKVTTDQYGRVTAGTSLLASDIPSGIDASKISTGVVSNTEFNFLDGTSANLQNQLSNLSATKANNVIVSGTSGLIGGGDLLQNRYIGMPNVGTAGTYTKTTTDQYGRVAAGGSLTSGDIPTLPATKIGTGIINDSEFNQLDGVSANIQTQLLTLSGTKADKAITISTGTMLSGGGDLSTNRTISHQTVGTAGTYSNFVTNSTGHITSARNLIAGDMPSGIDATKIADGSVTNTEFQYINTLSGNAQTQINFVSAAAFHTNRSNLDSINQNLSTTATVNFSSVSATNISASTLTVGSVSNTEFSYLDSVSANIQTQINSKQGNITIAQNQLAVGGTNTVSGSYKLTFDGTTLGLGIGTVINSPKFQINQNPGQAGGAEIILGAPAGIAGDENSSKLKFGPGNSGFRHIHTTEPKYKFQRYNTTTSAFETVYALESTIPSNKDVTFYGSVFAPSISATSITVGNIDNTEFNYLNGTSANIQNQLVALSANTALAANRYSTSINIMAGTNLYTITHNLGILRPHIDLFYNNEVVFASPKYIDINTLSITTTVPSTLNSVYIEVFK